MRPARTFWFAVVLAASTAPVSAQVVYGPGAIVARVRDVASRPLGGAYVEAVGPVTRSAATNGAGIATLVGLPAGVYDVSISLRGYTTQHERLAVAPAANAPSVIAPTLAAASFANVSSPATRTLPELDAGIDPYVAHALVRDAETTIVGGPGGAGVSLDGTLPYESRVELDGVPLAGTARSPNVIRLRNALGLTGIDVQPGPVVASPSLRNAVGGIIAYRTPQPGDPAVLGVDSGYDSAFGSFTHARAIRAFGNLSFAADAVTGGGSDRTQSLAARYALSPATTVAVTSYDLEASARGTSPLALSAPSYAASLHVALGGGTLEARSFKSALRSYTSYGAGTQTESDAVSGVQLGYGLPLGGDHVAFTFDRRTEASSFGAASTAQTSTAFAIHGEFALARSLRLELGDVYGGGTLVHRRSDPQAALTYRIGTRLTLRAEAGSAYATAPADLLVTRTAASGPLLPETAFGYRLSAEARLSPTDRLTVTAYRERRFETFTPLVNADARGFDLMLDHTPAHGLGIAASFGLARSTASGAPQPAAHVADAFVLGPGDALAGLPVAKARVGLTYRLSPACDERVGATYFGANNGFAGAATTLGEVALCVPLLGIVDVRVSENNIFGAAIRDPTLAPLFAPHEFTFALGLH